MCGASKVESHHEDYMKPLEVKWLCRAHHRALHVAKNQARALALKAERDLKQPAQGGSDVVLVSGSSVQKQEPAPTSPENLPPESPGAQG